MSNQSVQGQIFKHRDHERNPAVAGSFIIKRFAIGATGVATRAICAKEAEPEGKEYSIRLNLLIPCNRVSGYERFGDRNSDQLKTIAMFYKLAMKAISANGAAK